VEIENFVKIENFGLVKNIKDLEGIGEYNRSSKNMINKKKI